MTEHQPKRRDEIDLLNLLSESLKGIVKLIKSFIDLIVFLFVFGLWRIHWILLFIIAGGGFGYLRYINADRIYSSEMIAQPNGFTSIDMAHYINDIHAMCERNNTEGISNAFKISMESAEKIKNIEAHFFIDVNRDGIGDHIDYKKKFNPEDTTKTIIKNRILIRAAVGSNDVFHEVRTGLISYINANPYLIKVNEIRKMELKDQIAQADDEISKLDSLQNFEYYKSLDEGRVDREGQIVFMNEKQTQLYYQDKVSLLSKRLSYQKALELATEPITIIKDFTEFQAEENPKSEYLIKNGFFAACFGYVLLLLLNYRKSIITYLSSKR